MRIAVLGPLEVLTEDSAPVPIPGAKERLLLAVLAAGAPDVVPTDRLVDALWADAPPATARKSLQAHLVRLRSSLEPERPRGSTGRYVVRRGTGYALAVDRASIDALRMPDLAARGRAELATGHTAEAERELRAALDLWRGPPYADWPDAAFAEAERRRLAEVRASATEGLLTAALALGRHADVLPELERLVAEEPLQERWWQLLMLALYRAGRQADALGAGRRARTLLAEELGVDPGPELRAMEAAILAQDPAIDLPGPQPPADGHIQAGAGATCPYKGLASYQAADAALFHGRGRLVAGLVGRLVDARLVVVSGPSGAGKSSVVRAGLVPALVGGALPDSQTWRPFIVTPGHTPVDALAGLTGDPPPEAPVVLVCDQFEELWASGIDPAERVAFIDALLGLLDDGIAARCVVVVRGDHVGRLAEHPGFAERIAGTLVLVPPLTAAELGEVVRGPAVAVGLTAEQELVDAVVADVVGRPGALPLLSTALVGTWERRRGDRLTLSGYLEAGGVAGALTRSAESAYSALDGQGREVARRLLVRLADVDEGGVLVRRPVPLAELDLDGEGGAVRRQVVETFVGRRLLSVDGERLEVVHEALLTGWPRLASWLEDDAAGRAVRRHLAPAALEWVARGRPDEELYRGARLAAALDWAGAADADLTPAEQSFLEASRAQADAELDEARDRARQEARGRRRTRRLAVGLAAVLVLALVAAGLAARSQRAAEQATLVADANRLAALSPTVGSLDLSLLLAAQGFRLADTPQTENGLLSGLVEHRRVARVVPWTGGVFGGFLGNTGRTLFMGAGRRVLRWDIFSGEPPGVLLEPTAPWEEGGWDGWNASAASPTDDRTAFTGAGREGPWIRTADEDGDVELLADGGLLGGDPFGIAFTPDGHLLDALVAAPVVDGARAWRLLQVDPSDGTRRDTGITGTLPSTGEGGLGADISEDASMAVVWSQDDPARATLVDLASGRQATVEPPAREVPVADYFALSSGVAVLWASGEVTVADRTGGALQDLDLHGVSGWDVALAPDGTWAAVTGNGGDVLLWDVDPGTGRWSERQALQGHSGDVFEAEIDPSSAYLVTMSRDNTAILWDVRPDGGFGTSHAGLPGRFVANVPAVAPGGLVVAPTRPLPADGSGLPYLGEGTLGVAATFLDPESGAVVDQVDVGDTVADAYFGASVAVDPRGRWVAVTSGLATTVLDARTHQVVRRISLPPNENEDIDGSPYPAGVVCCAVWTPDGERLLIGTGGYLPGKLVDRVPPQPGEIAVVDTASWDVVDHVALDRAPEVMAFDGDGRWLAVASPNSDEVVILDADSLDERHRPPLTVDDSIWALSFSPDGRLLAGGGETGKVHVIDTGTWQPREAGAVRDAPTIQLEWLRDNRTVVTAGADGTVVLFDTERALARTTPLAASIHDEEGFAHLVPDPRDELVLFNDQFEGLRYPMAPSVWLRAACAIAGRDLTRAEWERYLPDREYEPTCSDTE